MQSTPCLRPLFLALAIGLAPMCAPAADKIPVEDFFRKQLVYSPSISPDGQTIAYGQRDEQDGDGDDFGVALLNLTTKAPEAFKLNKRSTVPDRWMDAQRLLLISEHGRAVHDLSRKKSVTFNQHEWFQIVSAPKQHPGWLNVFFFPGDHSLRSGLALIDPSKPVPESSGSINERYNIKSWIDVPPGEYSGAMTDWQGTLRAAVFYHNKNLRFHYRADEKSAWQALPFDAFDNTVFAFHPDPAKLYVVTRHGDEPTAGIYLFDVATGTIGENIFGDPEFSMTDASPLVSPVDGSLLGVHYQKDAPATHWLTSPMQQIQAGIDAKLAGRNNTVIDYDDRLEHFVIESIADRSPPLYFLYDKGKNTFAGLPDPYPWLRKATLQPTQSIRYKARDGLRLQGYLTLPAARADGAKPPLVVLAHGGPWVRDTWGYNPEVQFLASRGYAVFQPNYRGSAGFNDEVSLTHRYDFKIMHDDVTDGVKALIKSGRVDPQRIAIMGASHGGYLAVSGVAFEPELYKCAVTIVGVFDWAKRIKDRSGYRFDRSSEGFFLQRLGDPDAEAAKFEAMSPINYVDQIKVPIYVSAGKDDSNVDASQSTKLVSALKKNGVPVETFFPDREGHGYFYQKNRLRLYREIEAFLAKYL